MVTLRNLRGMNDLFESELVTWRRLERTFEQVFRAFCYQEIRTPILEELALFKRGIGDTTDIVEKEMFVVHDGDNAYCLRPENTAPVVRALIQRGGLSDDLQEKFYYIGPMFRKERPQRGRLRQFHQFGVELFGLSEPVADIELIGMLHHLFSVLKLSGVTLKINTLGIGEERAAYKSLLRDYLSNNLEKLCEDCKRRIATNPMRALDCKNPGCREVALGAPRIVDSIGSESRMHFDSVREGLTKNNVPFELDHQLVRGLDYYNRTVFEFVADNGLGSQNAVAAGGRYDGLFSTLGNKIDLPALGAAGGIERIVLLLSEQEQNKSSLAQLSLVGADDEGQSSVPQLAFNTRSLGVSTDFSLAKKSLKAQMRRADKIGAKFVIVLGGKEISSKRVSIKNLETGNSVEIALDAQVIAQFIMGT